MVWPWHSWLSHRTWRKAETMTGFDHAGKILILLHEIEWPWSGESKEREGGFGFIL